MVGRVNIEDRVQDLWRVILKQMVLVTKDDLPDPLQMLVAVFALI